MKQIILYEQHFLISFMEFFLSIVGINSWSNGVLFLKSLFLYRCLVEDYSCLVLVVSEFMVYTKVFGSFGVDFTKVIDMDLISFLCMWTSHFPCTICRRWWFSKSVFGSFVQDLHLLLCPSNLLWIFLNIQTHDFYELIICYYFKTLSLSTFSVTSGPSHTVPLSEMQYSFHMGDTESSMNINLYTVCSFQEDIYKIHRK